MRKTLTALLAAGVLLTGACGGSDDGDEEAGGDEATTSTIPQQEGPHAEFCERMLTSSSPPTDLEAPEEIAEDWAVLQEVFQAQQDQNQQRVTELQEEAGAASQRLMEFVQANCNIPGEGQMPEAPADGSATTAAG